MKFNIKESQIEGLKVITVVEGDCAFIGDLDATAYAEMGITDEMMSHCEERFARGVLRGLHLPDGVAQGRLYSVTSGRALVVAVDLRPESRTFGASQAVTLDTESNTLLYIPPYFAFGFLTLECDTEVVYNTTISYADPDNEKRIRWDDEILLIDWQFERYEIDRKYLNISQQDKKAPSFRSYNAKLLWSNRPKKSKYAKSY